ncbi:MAG: hypothetical protein EG826_07450 [Deltaproteobacteria bacterium]|nr:hypothetical protein [Deltaproteobacteria bacterium]
MTDLEVLQEVAAKVGINANTGQKIFYAMKDNFPVQFYESSDGSNPAIRGVIRFDEAGKDKLIKDALFNDKGVIESKLKSKNIKVADGIVRLKWNRIVFYGYPRPEKIAKQYLSVFGVVKSLCGAPGLKCRECGSEIDGPVLVNGLVDRLCPHCIEALKKRVEDVKAAYEAMPVNYPLGITAAVVLALVGAALWGGVTAATNKMYWAIAIVVGAAIGWGTTKAAGKGGFPIQVIVFCATLISVLLGMIFFAGYLIHAKVTDAGRSVDWVLFVRNLPGILLNMKGNVAFSMIGGGVGAVYAVARAAKPHLAVKVEK